MMRLSKTNIGGILMLLILLSTNMQTFAKEDSMEREAKTKIKELRTLTKRAHAQKIDTKREESALWMAETFLQYAAWDEENYDANLYQYTMYRGFKDQAEQMARELPSYERQEVNLMLDRAIAELSAVMDGTLKRRDIPKIDWTNIKPEGGSFVSNGRPVFINDYFTKTKELVNDYCGRVKGTNLSLGSIKNLDGELSAMGEEKIGKAPDLYSGYVLLWHSAPAPWARNIYGDMTKGKRYFTLYDIDNPNIRELWETTFSSTIPLLKDKRITDLGYILANEPHWFTVNNSWFKGDISDYTVQKFVAWLENRHGNIETLNRCWGSHFENFESVEFAIPFSPALLGSNSCYDWQRFNMDRVNEWFTFLDSGIKKYDHDAKTHIKYMPHLFTEDHRDHGLDFEYLIELTDISGNDAKITRKQLNKLKEVEYWEDRYAYDWRELSMSCDFYKSVAPNKPNVNSEGHFISSSNYRDQYITTDYTNSTYWLAAIHGQNVSFTWFWAREGNGIRTDLMKKWESDGAMNASYAASICTQPRVANQLSVTTMELTAFGEELTAMQSQKRPIRIFYSETSALKKRDHISKLFDLYESLYFEGMPIGFATERIIGNQDNDLWSVVIATQSEYVTDSEFAALQRYINSGGTVILDHNSLKFNEYGEQRKESLSSSTNGKVIAVASATEAATRALEYVAAQKLLPPLKLIERNSSNHKGCLWRVIPYIDGGQMLTIINLGNSTATIEISGEDDSIDSVVDLYTGAELKPQLEIAPEQVMLLQVK